MTFEEVTTPMEKRLMLCYAPDGNRIVRRRIIVRNVTGNLYMGEVEKRETCSYSSCDLYIYFQEYGIGFRYGTMPADESVSLDEKQGLLAETATPAAFLSFLDRCVEDAKYIRTDMIALAEYIQPDKAASYRESNAWILKLRDGRRRAEQEERQRREAEFVAKANAESHEKIHSAIGILRNGGSLKNDFIRFYRSRYDYSDYCVVNHLMRKYGIEVPLRTQGWINAKLKSVVIRNHRCTNVQYIGARKSTGAETVFRWMNSLVKAVEQEDAA